MRAKIKSIISKALKPKKRVWHIENTQSPMSYQIINQLKKNGFYKTKGPKDAIITDQNTQLDEVQAQLFEYKHQLCQLADFMKFDFMPKTYCIDHNNYQKTLAQIKSNYKNKKALNQKSWILKPSMTNNGEQIHLFKSLEEVEKHFFTDSLQGPQVLQEYIQNPHLIDNKKYTLRFFVILSNTENKENKKSWRYPKGYYNLSNIDYETNTKYISDKNLAMHLTNEHLGENADENINCEFEKMVSKNSENIKKNGEQDLGKSEKPNNKNNNKTHSNVEQICTDLYPDKKILDLVFKEVDKITAQTLKGMNAVNPDFLENKDGINRFDIFGYDFILDNNNKLWLLEINHKPCFPKGEFHPLKKPLFNKFWEDIFNKYIMSIINGIS